MTREQRLKAKRIYSNSGITYRHSVLEEFGNEDHAEHIIFHPAGEAHANVSERMKVFETHAAKLSEQAVASCFLSLPSLEPSQITHLVTFSCTGMYAPGLDIELVELLGLSKNVERTCVNFMGCYAAINALKLAYHIARSEPEAIILIAGVELCSLHYQKSFEDNQVISNALFSDGAAAAIISSQQLNDDQKHINLKFRTFYSEFDIAGINEMIWRIGDFGFNLTLSPEVPRVVRENINQLAQKLLQKANLEQKDISYYAIHPGGMKILEACETALGLSKENNKISYEVLKNFGNMSSVTILFVLEKFLKTLSLGETGRNMLACAFGPGLTIESMIVETC